MIKGSVHPRKILEKEAAVKRRLIEKREGVLARFPLMFTFLATFGLVATFYGFERLIDRVEVLAENPFLLLGTGIITLIITGSLYKKLG